MSVGFKVEGFREMERALAQLKRGTAKAAVRRAIKTTLQPVKQAAEASPFTIAITSRLTARQKAQARGDQGRSVLSLYVGPVDEEGKGAPHAHLQEFGTAPRYHRKSGKYVGSVMADPFMRPAWDARKGVMLEELGKNIWLEIEKSLARATRKAAR